MKKIVSFLALAAFALVLTGCGNTLTCKKDDQSYEITFKGDKVSKVVMSATYDTVDDAKEDEEYLKDYYTSDGMKVSRKGKKLSLTLTGSAVENYDGTKSELKEELEEDGYKCK